MQHVSKSFYDLADLNLNTTQLNQEILAFYTTSFKSDKKYNATPLTLQHFTILLNYYIYTAQNKTSLAACKHISPNDVYSAYLNCCENL